MIGCKCLLQKSPVPQQAWPPTSAVGRAVGPLRLLLHQIERPGGKNCDLSRHLYILIIHWMEYQYMHNVYLNQVNVCVLFSQLHGLLPIAIFTKVSNKYLVNANDDDDFIQM